MDYLESWLPHDILFNVRGKPGQETDTIRTTGTLFVCYYNLYNL